MGGGDMKRDKSELEKKLCLHYANTEDRNKILSWCMKLEEKYNIPINLSSDIIGLRKDLSECDAFTLFAMTDITYNSLVKGYFTDREIKTFTTHKVKSKKIKFPIKLEMFQVTPDQWIGVSSVKFLMQLRDAQYINYNADTQRALEIIVRGGREIFRPYVDVKAVKEIEEAYESRTFIPNTISFNINQDDEKADFEFKDNVLTIYEITAFDIFDGYHRYLGMGRNYDRDNSFDYPTELRITNFSVSKAKQFIYQEDHKTKMKKVNREAYNQQNAGNLICDRINTNSSFNLYGEINLAGGRINYGELSSAINAFFLDNKKAERKEIIRLSNLLITELNGFTEEFDEYLDRKWERFEIYEIIYGLSQAYSYSAIKAAINNTDKDHKKTINYYISGVSKKRLINALEEVF
jgi:hypothetical protein